MKNLIVAAFLSGSMVAMAEEVAVKSTNAVSAAVETAAKKTSTPLTEEQRAEILARREKLKAEYRAELEKKALGIVKKYGLDDKKSKALFDWLLTTEGQRAEARIRFDKTLSAQLEKNALDEIKTYGLSDKKSKALFYELQTPMRQLRQLSPLAMSSAAKPTKKAE